MSMTREERRLMYKNSNNQFSKIQSRMGEEKARKIKSVRLKVKM